MSVCNKNSVCGDYDIVELDELVLVVSNEIHKISINFLNNLKYGYKTDPACNIRSKNNLNRLNTYFNALRLIKLQIVSGSGSCLSKEEVQCLFEKIYNIVGKNCKPIFQSLIIDDSSEEAWLMNNPYCRTYEEWNKWSKHICAKLDIELKTEVLKQNFILEISRKVITPNVIVAISAIVQARELKLELNRDDVEIELDHSLLLENVMAFNLSKKEYQTAATKHNLSYDIVKSIYEEGLEIVIEGEEAFLKTYVDKYKFSDISGSVNHHYLKKFGMKATINKTDLLQDFK